MPPARRPLPPLTSLRSFEAAARHLSFTNAAKELFVTQTAISHQVKVLEAHLGAQLFRRSPRRIALTSLGSLWAAELREVFARLHEANRRLSPSGHLARKVVSVSVIPSFGARWLVPRLGQFLGRHPGCDVRIASTEQLVDFDLEPVDVGIRYGSGRYPGLVVEKLVDDAYVVVCAPALAAKKKLATPRDLARHVLLHDDAEGAWSAWLTAHRVTGVDGSKGSVLTDSSMLVDATVSGNGVALARWSLVSDDLAAGRLVRPFPRFALLPTGFAYYLVARRSNLARPEVKAFCDWVRIEAGALAPSTITAARARRPRARDSMTRTR
jgi:LysR family glycine cleavage system transcriptional activator